MLKRIAPFIVLAASLSLAGPNADATFVIDMDPSTPEIENELYTVTEGETFDIAVMGSGFVDIVGLTVMLAYDAAMLTPGTVNSAGYGMANVLDNNPIGFATPYPDSAMIEYTLTQGATPSANAEGLVAIFSFTANVPVNQTTPITFQQTAATASTLAGLVNDLFDAPNDAFTDGLYGVIEELTLTVATTGSGTTTPAAGDIAVVGGVATELTATPDDACTQFDGWTVTAGEANVSNLASLDLSAATISPILSGGNATFQAAFSTIQYTLEVDEDGDGTADQTLTVDCGVATDITAATLTGQTFSGWTVTAGTATLADASAAATTATLDAENATVTANFDVNTYTVTIAAGANGSVDPSGEQTVAHGDSIEVTATADENYELVDWAATAGESNVVIRDNAATTTWIVVTGDATVEATFGEAVGVAGRTNALPTVWGMQAARNSVVYSVPADNQSAVTLKLFSMEGQLVRSYKVSSVPGRYVLDFAKNGESALSHGQYLCNMRSGSFNRTAKVWIGR